MLTRRIDSKSNMAEFGESRLENVVEYKIFDLRSFSKESEKATNVKDTLYAVLSYAQSLIGDYIWQNECFNLKYQELGNPKPKEIMGHLEQIHFLEGSSNFGDNIEDEWFIVYVLFSITKQFPHLVATVNDNDGEFLLIEAAEYLPKWLEPETSENRVFIHQGNLHVIPLPQKPSEVTVFPTGKPSVCQSLKILLLHSEKTAAFPWIQDPIMKKITEYPKKAKDCFHNVLCFVPSQVKYLLERKNSLISPAVLAFVNHDPVDMTTCQKLKHFSVESLVPYRVCFTKCLYGQLVKQNFIPDKSTMKYLPEVSNPTYKGHVIGLQLTHGFELMCNQFGSFINGEATANPPSGEQWEKYLTSLINYGYFQNEVVGSRLYTQLLGNAKEYFNKICLHSAQSQNDSNEIKKLLKDMPMVNKTSAESIPESFPPDDDEQWLEVSPQELDSILSQYGQTGLPTSEDVDLREVVNGMNTFVKSMSSYEGAEFPSELGEDPEIHFDPEGFMKSFDILLNKASNNVRSDDSTSSDDDSNDDEQINEYTSAMDQELSETNVGKSFVKFQEKSEEKCSNDESAVPTESNDEESAMKPVDIDLNLVQNFLESYSLQEGLPGPVSNILSSLGITLPENLEQSHF